MKYLKEDLSAAIVVYLVALPLCLGISLASGAPLLSGIISGIIGGIVVGAISGSQMSVSGPAAGLAAVVFGSIAKLGSFEIFSMSLVLAGVFQLAGGLCKAGVIANYIPSNVIKGLLASIGLLLILKQVPHAIGYDIAHEDAFSFFQPNGENTFTHLFGSFSHFTGGAILIGFLSVFLLVLWDRNKHGKKRLIPGAVLVVLAGIMINEILRAIGSLYLTEEHLVTIPKTSLFELLQFKLFSLAGFANPAVWTTALTLAVVASLETLLNLEAVDKLDPHKRESPPNRELVAQGIGNMLAGMVGGLPVTSVIVRSSVNIEAGAKSKLSSILHGVLLLVSVLTLTLLINRIPLASLAAILIMTGYKLANPRLFREMYQKGPNQYLPFFATIMGILMTDLLIGVVIGLAISVFFLLKNNLKNPFSVEMEFSYNNNETIRIELPSQVSFLNKATIKATLWDVPHGARVIINAEKVDYIDPDVLEILEDFKTIIVPERDLKLNMTGVKNSYELSDHVQFINVLDKKTQFELTPQMILELLKQGNERFLNGKWSKKEFLHQVNATSLGQNPMAVILSCIDSRTTPEIIFDTNLGDILSMRIAGNIVSEEIIGSVELSCLKLGTKLIVVMGHANCGAIGAAVNSLREGKIMWITDKIIPAVTKARTTFPGLNSAELVEAACKVNIQQSIEEILSGSSSIKASIEDGKIGIVSAYYDTVSGRVEFGSTP